VVELTGNRALALLCAVAGGLIADQLARAQAPDTEIKAVTPDVIERADRAVYDAAHKAHTRLVALIAAGDEAGAVALWRRHLELGTAHLVRETGPELDLLP
jgi:DNA-binding GntR family transcriptional regulator